MRYSVACMDTYVILVSSRVREDHNTHHKRVETGRGASAKLICCYSEICPNFCVRNKEVFGLYRYN